MVSFLFVLPFPFFPFADKHHVRLSIITFISDFKAHFETEIRPKLDAFEELKIGKEAVDKELKACKEELEDTQAELEDVNSELDEAKSSLRTETDRADKAERQIERMTKEHAEVVSRMQKHNS